MRTRIIVPVILAFMLAGHTAWGADHTAELQVRDTLSVFLKAFGNLDWPAFRACFAPDPTMFHPAAPNALRIDTPEQFERAWAGVFERIRRFSKRETAPYMTLEPKDLRIELLAPNVALVTFHILGNSEIDRRTIVFKRYGNDWKIVHIHASNLAVAQK